MKMNKTNESLIGEQQQDFKIGSSMNIGYVSLNVTNLQRSLDFYEKILGFKILSRISDERALLSVDGSSSNLIELLKIKANTDNDSFDPLVPANRRAGLYHFAILLPERKYLADMLQNLSDNRDQVYFDGLADHLVSEAIYIRDPDFIGIEIYRDRPMTDWKWDGNRIEAATLPLDTKNLLRESTDEGWKEMPSKTTIGHVHLHVGNLAKTIEFYQEILGLNLTASIPSAAFFAAGKYHHHIGTNTWLGTDIRPASPQSVGLNHFSIDLPSKEEFQRVEKRLSRYGKGLVDLEERSGFTYDSDGIKIQVRYQ
ncbi:MAG TPA: VOC family protein [Nitrososphaera sp.]|nr:VOC family protein [Nitrososphaera sp.]